MLWDRFDAVALACYTKYEDRVIRIREEFSRVGLSGVQLFWQIPNPYDQILMDAVPSKNNLMRRRGHFSCSFNHYRIAKTLLDLGKKHVLIMEDDIVFLKDKELLDSIVSSLPEDADVALFEWRTAKNLEHLNRTSIERDSTTGFWHRADDMQLVGCGMYYLSERGLRWFVSRMEEGANGGELRTSDGWFRRGGYRGDVIPYCAKIRAAIQDSDVRCNSRGDPEFVLEEYRLAGLTDPTLYNIRAGREPDMTVSSSDPVDAVFAIGGESQHDNEELRYALRALEQNLKFVRNVYIVGECPAWIDKGKVKHLPWPDRFEHAKDANIIDKFRHACEDKDIAKRVLLCSDDQFQTRPCTWEEFSPMYLRKYDKDDPWYEERKRLWHSRLRRTMERDRLRRIAQHIQEDGICYWEPHIYAPVDRDQFIAYAKWSDYEHRDDTIIFSGYYNFVGQVGTGMHDHDFITNGYDWSKRKLHIAYNDDTYDKAMEYLRPAFPNPSRFELQTVRDYATTWRT